MADNVSLCYDAVRCGCARHRVYTAESSESFIAGRHVKAEIPIFGIMHIEQLREYCLAKPATSESFPFGPETLVFKVMGKVFLLAGLDEQPCSFNVKCEPEYAIELREQYPDTISGAYHMNKKHWNTVVCDGRLTDDALMRLVDHSYELVVAGLPKKDRDSL